MHLFILAFEVFSFLSLTFFSTTSFFIVLWIYFCIKIFVEVIFAPYWDKTSRGFNCWLLLVCLGASTIFFFGFHVVDADKVSIMFLLLVLDLPFSAILSLTLLRLEERKIKEEFMEIMKEEEETTHLDIKEYGLDKLDRLVRCNFFKNSNSLPRQEKNTIFLYSAISLSWLHANEQKVPNVFENTSVKLELINRLASKFETETKMKKSKKGLHFYLSFLLHVSNNHRLFWLISQKLKRQEGIDFKS